MRISKKIRVITYLVFFIINSLNAQSLDEEIQDFIKEIRKEGVIQFRIDFSEFESNELLAVLDPYSDDNDPNVRFAIRTIYYGIYKKNLNSPKMRAIVVSRFLKDCFDEDREIWITATKGLYRLVNYSNNSISNPDNRNKLRELIKEKDKLNRETIMLMGLANLVEEKEMLTQWIEQSPLEGSNWYKSKTWAAYLALARFGEEKYVSYCNQKIKAEEDYNILATLLFNHLAYIKQKSSIDLLTDYVFSEKVVSGDRDILGFVPARYAAEELFKVIEHPDSINEKYVNLQQARTWLKNQKDLTIKK